MFDQVEYYASFLEARRNNAKIDYEKKRKDRLKK